MNLLTLFGLAVALAMDAFAVALAAGLALPEMNAAIWFDPALSVLLTSITPLPKTFHL